MIFGLLVFGATAINVLMLGIMNVTMTLNTNDTQQNDIQHEMLNPKAV
jgi:hypothetical protein